MENYIVSARKYRPSTFQSVVGQRALTQTLKNAIGTQKLAHAYLFCGPRGVGKTTCARIFAKTINCLSPTAQGEACNECESCKAFNEKRSYNIIELDAASNNSVDDMRNLTDQVRIPPQIGSYKVFIIDEVHMLSSAAFNAFLKTLEEPPSHALFILATTEKHKIIPTILSRCQIYDFQRITISDTVAHLTYVAQQEGIAAEEEALAVIAQKSDGGMRDALSTFDQIASFSGGNITYRSVIENLNILDYEYYFRVVEAFLQHAVSPTLLILNEILAKGFDGQLFINGLASHLRNLLVSKEPSTLSLLEAGEAVAQRYAQQATQCDPHFLFKALELCNTCDLNYRQSRNKRLLVELTLIQVCQWGIAPPAPPAEGIQRVAQPQPQQQPVATTIVATPPVAPTATATPTQQVQQATPATPQAVAPTPAPPKPPTAAPLKRQAPPTISIRKPMQKESQEQQQVTPTSTVTNTPFDEAKLHQAWNSFIETIPTEAVLVNTMRSCLPSLQSATSFEVVVDNKDQLIRLQEKSTDLMQYLKSTLQNTQIEIHIRESAKRERVRAFSQREKLDEMVQANPHIVNFIDKFGLELA